MWVLGVGGVGGVNDIWPDSYLICDQERCIFIVDRCTFSKDKVNARGHTTSS